MRVRKPHLGALALLVLTSAGTAVGDDAGMLTGRVTVASAPLEQARVYAYQLADFSLEKVVTDQDGSFVFQSLPAGLYKVIAFKAGFAPAVVMLSRATAQAKQYLDVQLRRPGVDAVAGDDFWAVRQRVPADVLRDIEQSALAESIPAINGLLIQPAAFSAKMEAVAGTRNDLDYGDAQVTGGRVGLEGRFGDIRFDVDGRYSQLDSNNIESDTSGSAGRTQQVSLNLESPGNARIGVSSQTMSEAPASVDFQSHRISWSQPVGSEARSDFSAMYTSENNYYRQAPLESLETLPEATRSWGVEGSYTTPVSGRSSIQAGFRYRERQIDYGQARLDSFSLLPLETVEVFGRGGVEVKPAVVVEYGLYSRMNDGSVSLAPQGGVVLRVGPNWRASTTASRQVHRQETDEYRNNFNPAYFREYASCAQADEYCYQMLVSRLGEADEQLSVGAIHRKISETLRLYFSEDFFNRNDSLFLVEGDRLPEVQFEMTRRLAPQVLTRLESNVGAGGGGTMYSQNRPYENSVRYMVTSLDTRFENSSTGVFVAFHRIEQELDPIGAADVEDDPQQVELERLQLTVTQDLSLLSQMAADWAVRLNMELSRGTSTSNTAYDPDDLRKRVTGGITVTF